MSVKAMDWVWRNSRATCGDLLTLLAIADHSDDQGNAYPSVAALAKKARITERHAQRVLRNLEHLGELKIERQRGRNGVNLYKIKMTKTPDSMPPDKMSPRQNDGVTCESQRGDAHVTPGVTPMSPEPSLNRQESSLSDNSSVAAPERGTDPGQLEWFERFYTNYPRKKDRRDAEKAFKAALKRGADPEHIITQAAAYAACVKAEKTESKYVKLPATWLNKGSYEDDFTPTTKQTTNSTASFTTEEYNSAF